MILTESSAQELLEQAVSFHRNGQLHEAEKLYLKLLAFDFFSLAVKHNLGTLNLSLGKLKTALKLIDEVVLEDPNNAEQYATYKLLAKELYRNNHWEAARPWLEKAILVEPNNHELISLLERVKPRDYLEPEVYDPQTNRTLLRYSPREAETYVYTIDISGTCNLRCPSCPVGNFSIAERNVGMMSVSLFTSILNKIKQESITTNPQIWLYNWGEPMLHPKLAEIIKIVKDHGFSVHISTNLNTEQGIEKLAKSNPDEIKISLSGFSEQTYSKTHKRGNISLLKSNMYLLRYYLDKYKSNTNVWVGQHLYKNNFHEKEMVNVVCRELNFSHSPMQAFFQPIEKLVKLMKNRVENKDEDILSELLMDPRKYIPNVIKHRSGDYDCELRFNQTVINYDGEVALCCGVYDKKNMLGVNFLERSHQEIETLKYQHPFCQTCRKNGCDYSSTEPMDKN
jgi:MoaA/NifB/PqqE/SkfB family radical SAM enzyme